MTTTNTIAPKAQKALDVAAANGWTSDIVENSENYTTITITHPSPQKWGLAEIKLAFHSPEDGKWNFDYGQTRAANDDGSISYATTKIALRDAMSVIQGSYSPRAQASKALDDMAIATRREALAAAYKAEPDLPIRRSIRDNLTYMVNATAAQDKFNAEREEHSLQWACEQYLEDALIEQHLARQAQSVFNWEGQVDQKGTKVVSLEEAVVRSADGALTRLLGHATRGSTGSTSKLRNAWTDIAAVADAKFVERFHPIQGCGGLVWQIREILDLDWISQKF